MIPVLSNKHKNVKSLFMLESMLVPIKEQLIHSTLRDDVTMKCTFQTNGDFNYRELQIHWYLYKNEDSINVHSYLKGADQLTDQHSSFHGRTQLFTDELNRGIISLRISNLMISDGGSYQCVLICRSAQTHNDSFKLTVTAPYEISQSNPIFNGEESLLQCELKGGYPKAEIIWTTKDGQKINKQISTNYSITKEGCFNIISNLSLKLQKNTTICCTLSHPELPQKRISCQETRSPSSNNHQTDEDMSLTPNSQRLRFLALMTVAPTASVIVLLIAFIAVLHHRQKQETKQLKVKSDVLMMNY
uniref:Ig-like domain-containing protein n=1 Tax=Latimeria chalumnae TaxID=7897 RepID=M3XGW5_LATCH